MPTATAAGGLPPWKESPAPVDPATLSTDPTSPSLTLLALFLSVLGFLGVALILWGFKYDGVGQTVHGLPTRVLFVFALAFAAAPFFVTIFRKVPLPALILPVVLVVMLYPLFSPYGIPFSRDPVFNFQFSQVILGAGSWAPASGVTAQAVTYSYYPGGAVFNAEVAQLTGLSLSQTFNWSYELFRLLVIPFAIYALTTRLFGRRPAPLAVLFYIAVPSIELNIPTQQDFAVTFFLLAITAMTFLVTTPAVDSLFLRIAVVGCTALVIVSHHVSTYLLVMFLLGIAVIPFILRRKDMYPNVRAPVIFLRTLALGLVWVALVTLPVLTRQYSIFSDDLAAVIHPSAASPAATPVPGSSFPTFELVWIAIAIAITAIGAVVTLVEKYRREEDAFVVVGIITVFLVAIFSIPFLSTGLSFLALRQLEYSGVFLAPVAAWWITERVARGHLLPPPTRAAPIGASRSTTRRPGLPRLSPRRAGTVAVAGILTLVIVTGGFLVPLSTRDQFANPSNLTNDSPLYINENALAAANWAATYIPRDHAFWGDQMTYTVFGGFGHFKVQWDSYPLFQGTTFSAAGVDSLHKGDLVSLDTYMTTPHLNPIFPGPLTDQPAAGMVPAADLDKFSDSPDFALVFENSVFTVYEVVGIPAVGSG